jgi:hypothetical protein
MSELPQGFSSEHQAPTSSLQPSEEGQTNLLGNIYQLDDFVGGDSTP